jgi:ABC-2 type transport system permease protein
MSVKPTVVAGKTRGRDRFPRPRTSWEAHRRMVVLSVRFFMREPFAVFFTLAFPVLLVLTMGAAFGDYDAFGAGGFKVSDVTVPATMALVAGNLGLMGIPIAIAEMRQTGMLRRYRITPTPLSSVFVSSIISWLFMFVVASLLSVLVTLVVFGLRFDGNLAALALGATLCATAMFALGFAIGGFVATGRAAQAVGSAVFFPMLFLSGASFPRDQFPTWLQDVGEGCR